MASEASLLPVHLPRLPSIIMKITKPIVETTVAAPIAVKRSTSIFMASPPLCCLRRPEVRRPGNHNALRGC